MKPKKMKETRHPLPVNFLSIALPTLPAANSGYSGLTICSLNNESMKLSHSSDDKSLLIL